MKDAYEVLYRKEADLVRVRQEIESLTVVASLLAEDGDEGQGASDQADDESTKKPSGFEGQAFLPLPEPQATGTDGQSDIAAIWQPKKSFWNVLTGKS